MTTMDEAEAVVPAVEDDAVRFEDLTVDDDLPLLERVVRYSRSQIALQRLVHVKMLAETAEIVGMRSTQQVIVPLLRSLVTDPESIIRQHVSTQLVPICIVAIVPNAKVSEAIRNFSILNDDNYDETGYALVLKEVVQIHLQTLVQDVDVDVRRAAADCLAQLARYLRPSDISERLVPICAKLAAQLPKNPSATKKKSEQDQHLEELRICAGNLLAELGGAASEYQTKEKQYVETDILPLVLQLCKDSSFRVRRSAAQALPRVLGACDLETVENEILPAFERLSQDDLYRVRKATGECLVDMSRSLMFLDAYELRRRLIPIADALIQDSHKMVRQGMMQFLGPFMASFFPLQNLKTLLPALSESDGANHVGICAQFFPHASSMVSRLNAAMTTTLVPTPVNVHLDDILRQETTREQALLQALPAFLQASRLSAASLQAVTSKAESNQEDVQALVSSLLDYFAALAIVNTGDENTDAEMRVYCAYSFPAIVLLLGKNYWEGAMRTCFLTLVNPDYSKQTANKDPPLPVKRCLASSLHTVAHILGPELAAQDILPIFCDFFLKDTDESVRLNVLRNFAALVQVLEPQHRRSMVKEWSRESLELLSTKRSAHNPVVLNWRQRDYLARSLPDLILLLEADLLSDHVWPILQLLLLDSVSIVRDDAIWSVAILLQKLTKTAPVVDWLQAKILSKGQGVNFSQRQVYCRICGTLGLALSFAQTTPEQQPVLSERFLSYFFGQDSVQIPQNGPYQSMPKAEQKHVRKILLQDLLPAALEMKEDRISNVRVTLMKTLQLMPLDIQSNASVKPILKALVDDVETWENFCMPDKPKAAPKPAPPPQRSSGPVDLDEAASREVTSDENEDDDDTTSHEEYQTVVFQDGPIGMQLEPTANDDACRVYGFLDGESPSPARLSGKIQLGDVIVKVNNKVVTSYDDTIAILKAGGVREIVFRPGTADEETSEEYSDDDRKERERKAKKEAKKQRKTRKEEKKKKKDKDKDKSAKKRSKKKE